MTTRRKFLASGSATLLAALDIPPDRGAFSETHPMFPISDFENRIRHRDFRDVTKAILPTPSMIVDLDLLEANVARMAEQSKKNGINVRPHFKVHKSVDVARMQVAHGAIGLTCATIAEAELMSASGLKNILWTKQPASVNNIARAVTLTKRDPTFMFVVDDPIVVDWVEEAAAAEKAKCRIVVAVFANADRQGIENGKPAVALAQKIAASSSLRLEGYMGYSGVAAHTKGFEARYKQSAKDLAGLHETVELSRKSGLPPGILSGGSTGTYNIDHENGLTELQAGSYVFHGHGLL